MKAAVEHVEQQYAFSQRRACSLLMVAVSSVRYTCVVEWYIEINRIRVRKF